MRRRRPWIVNSWARVLIVEADNALGSRCGDVDDGFALAALLGGNVAAMTVVSTFGNTSETEADANNRALVTVSGVRVRHVRGAARRGQQDAEAVTLLCDAGKDAVLLALGPLTTLAAALVRNPDLQLAGVVVVGGDMQSRGRWPPLWPHEFNFCLDRKAACAVFASHLPLTLVPLDVGRRMLLPRRYVEALPGRVGGYLGHHAARRLTRNRRWLRVDALRGYDLLAAMTVLAPDLLQCSEQRIRLHRRAFLARGVGREVKVVVDFDAPAILATLAARVGRLGAPPQE